MMKSKHTPGKWSLPHFARPEVNCQCAYILSDEHMGAIASVHCSGDGEDWKVSGDNPKFEQAVANARLIAAAPDLLTELWKCLRFLEDMHVLSPEWTVTESAVLHGEISAAIAKATGGES